MGSQGGAIREPKNGGGSLARQGSSLYNLTLDEVQNQLGNLGKPLGSMNLDELLKSVWTVEAAAGSGADDVNNNMQQQQPNHGQLGPVTALNPQGSITLSGDLSKKTIDEVWRDMQRRKGGGGGGGSNDGKTERQPTLGEMTLEDFLAKAGVVAESFGVTAVEDNNAIMSGADSNVASQQNVSQHAHWMQYQLAPVQQPQQQNQQGNMMAGFMAGPVVQQSFPVGVTNPVLDAGYSDAMVNMSPSSLMGTLSDTQAPGRKRVASGNVVEKIVERRQKRMIKNRESAARSRARKQAYTQELEIKVSRLEEENERLRRLHEIERVLPSAPPPDPRHQLRRTSSAPL